MLNEPNLIKVTKYDLMRENSFKIYLEMKWTPTVCLWLQIWVLTLCRPAPSTQQDDFLEKRLSICQATGVILPCDWLSCVRVMRLMKWLAESIIINHHTLWRYLPLRPVRAHIVLVDVCTWTQIAAQWCSHSLCAQDRLLYAWNRTSNRTQCLF